MSLCQKIPLTGAAVVSTPQDLAFNVAEKAIFMFTKLRTPVLGLVENMSGFECRHCGHREEIFGSGGARRFAMANEIPFLGEIPLSTDIRTTSDAGKPHRPVHARVAERPRLPPGRREPRGAGQHPHPGWSLHRSTGDRGDYAAIRERGAGFSGRTGTRASTPAMPCAWAVGARSASTRCQGTSGFARNRSARMSGRSRSTRSGRYAIRFHWSDGHSTGIYTFELLRQLCPCPICAEKSRAQTR